MRHLKRSASEGTCTIASDRHLFLIMSSTTVSKVLVLGATGYIGGEAYVRIYQKYPTFEYTAIVRSQDNVEKMRAAGAKNVILDPDTSLSTVLQEVEKSDIVLHCADADDLELMRTILRGAKKVHERTGKRIIYIHTSGTGLVTDKATGNLTAAAKGTVYDDGKVDDICAIDVNGPHRNVDLEIFEAGKDGYVNAYIIAPATIYGTGEGPVRRISQQIPNLVRAMLKRGRGFYVGEGTNVWPGVHIRDMGELYALVLTKALSEDAVANKEDPFERFYWAANSEFCYGDVEKQIAQQLVKKGRIPDGLDNISYEELIALNPGLSSVAKNSRCRGTRGQAIGWKPKSKSVFETLEEDVDFTLEQL
ncbi:NAD(P)-binding protein [Auriculariales sp. MPI-PUGE-AT-0066]|nr:NAD(P)-binding protein [Auriculariales sp. MPI-PUGE-AT-0066]